MSSRHFANAWLCLAATRIVMVFATATITPILNERANGQAGNQERVLALSSTNFCRRAGLPSIQINERDGGDRRSRVVPCDTVKGFDWSSTSRFPQDINNRRNSVSRLLLWYKMSGTDEVGDDATDDYWKYDSLSDISSDEWSHNAIVLPPDSDGSELFSTDVVGSNVHSKVKGTGNVEFQKDDEILCCCTGRRREAQSAKRKPTSPGKIFACVFAIYLRIYEFLKI